MLCLCRNNTNTTTKTKTNTNTNTNTITNTIAKKVRGICYISAGTMRRPAGGGNLSTNQVKSSSALNLFMILLKTNTTLQLDCRRIRPLQNFLLNQIFTIRYFCGHPAKENEEVSVIQCRKHKVLYGHRHQRRIFFWRSQYHGGTSTLFVVSF